MASEIAPTKDFAVTNRFPPDYNRHYNFADPANIDEIARQDELHQPGALMTMTPYLKGGGSKIDSPWGTNRSLECDDADENTVQNYLARFGLTFDNLLNADAKHGGRADPVEFCVKDLVVRPGNQLSLQKHQGREEFWIVKTGLLTVIVDGEWIDVEEGQGIFIPKGSVHCMNNRTDADVVVEELQLGICREEDNVRLLDATRDAQGNPKPRPTYPLTTENEYLSAQIFAKLANEIAADRKLPVDPNFNALTLQRA